MFTGRARLYGVIPTGINNPEPNENWPLLCDQSLTGGGEVIIVGYFLGHRFQGLEQAIEGFSVFPESGH